MRVSMNIYHQTYRVGDYVKLIQFTYEKPNGELFLLRVETLLAMIQRRKVNCRYVKVRKVVVRIVECVEHEGGGIGYVGLLEGIDKMVLSIAHNQYPDYTPKLANKFLWVLYTLNLGVRGKWSEGVYEEYHRVVSLMTDKYIPIRIREMVDPDGLLTQPVSDNRLRSQGWKNQ